jgi:4-hydroxy-3-methylbut-2-enyl diphosphate reductase
MHAPPPRASKLGPQSLRVSSRRIVSEPIPDSTPFFPGPSRHQVQRRIEAAIRDRDSAAKALANFRFFDTICGATQERQDALRVMLDEPMDLLLVVGGYNSSNTSHLAEMGEEKLPTYFIRNASRLESRERIVHYNLHQKTESATENWLPARPLTIGITAGASCPNNLIEETILRLFELHGIEGAKVLDA